MQDYIQQAIQTEAFYSPAYDRLNTDRNILRLLHAAMGMGTEVGEFTDQLKKHIFYGKPLDVINLKEEVGDLLWYIAVALDVCGVKDISEVMQQNIDKLRARYPNKFTEYDAEHRDLEKEREILEVSPPGMGLGFSSPKDWKDMAYKSPEQIKEIERKVRLRELEVTEKRIAERKAFDDLCEHESLQTQYKGKNDQCEGCGYTRGEIEQREMVAKVQKLAEEYEVTKQQVKNVVGPLSDYPDTDDEIREEKPPGMGTGFSSPRDWVQSYDGPEKERVINQIVFGEGPSKGGQNPPNTSDARPPAPCGSDEAKEIMREVARGLSPFTESELEGKYLILRLDDPDAGHEARMAGRLYAKLIWPNDEKSKRLSDNIMQTITALQELEPPLKPAQLNPNERNSGA
jgi:NTP pyrophosphatase (non-canonical NTP hydrolase)